MKRVQSIAFGCAMVVAAGLTACGNSSATIGAGAVPSVSPPGPALTYVAVGASETLGFGADDPVRQAWTQVFYRTALPRAATMVNLGVPGATVQEALQHEVPEVKGLHPDVVTVWLNVNDLLDGVAPGVYQQEITGLLDEVRGSGGDSTVLVANTPPLDQLPRFVECEPYAPSPSGGCDQTRRMTAGALNRLVDDYNSAIKEAAALSGAIVIDLYALGLAARRDGTEGTLVSGDGFHPSTEGHLAVGLAFAAALRTVPVGCHTAAVCH